MKNRILFWMLYGFVFATGATGLIYQVTWQKYISRLLGSDSIAIAITLATFLGGLSAGYLVCGRLTVRVQNHFKGYAVLEGLIGAWGLLFPTIFQAVESLTRTWRFEPPVMIIIQGFWVSVLLTGLPTICMGGTIPFLTRGISRNISEATKVHSIVYAVNTIGASFGALLAGFYLIVQFGLPLTVMGTAFINLLVFLFFFLVSGQIPIAREEKGQEGEEGVEISAHLLNKQSAYPNVMLYSVAFLSGFYVMTLENVLIRIAGFAMGSSTYTFSIIVSVFIFSIASGSYVVSRLADLKTRLLVLNQAAITLLLLIVYLSLDTWPYWAHVIRVVFQSNIAGFYGYHFAIYIVLCLILFFPVSLMGATVPILFHEIKRDLSFVGRHSGALFSWNAFGNLTGSLMGGILFYYFFNNDGVFLMAAVLAGVSACLACFYWSKKYLLLLVPMELFLIIAVFATPGFDIHRFMLGTFRFKTPLATTFAGPEPFFKQYTSGVKHLFYKDDITSSVSVVESIYGETVSRSIVVNGKSDSSTFGDIYTLKLSAHIPALFSTERKSAMVIGMGTGISAGELTLYPDLRQIDVAEISPAVIDTMPLFSPFNHKVMDDPRIRIHMGDAFRILGRSDQKWDIILSEPSNPWVTGVDLLFSDEFYQLVNAHLTDNGIFVQWFHSYSASPEMLSMIMKTLSKNFSEIRVFGMSSTTDLMAIATNRDLTLADIRRGEAYLNTNKAVADSLKEIGIHSMDGILIREFWSTKYIRDKSTNAAIQTLDNPRLHYIAGNCFFTDQSVDPEFFLNVTSVPYADSYLLFLKYPQWLSHVYTDEEFHQLMASTKRTLIASELPMREPLQLKQFWSNPDAKIVFDTINEGVVTDYLPYITGSLANPDWEKIGLGKTSYLKKCQFLNDQMIKTRSWIFPYPIDGLLSLLRQGIQNGADPFEKNRCSLLLIKLLVEENSERETILPVFENMIRDDRGFILLEKEDIGFFKEVAMRLKG